MPLFQIDEAQAIISENIFHRYYYALNSIQIEQRYQKHQYTPLLLIHQYIK